MGAGKVPTGTHLILFDIDGTLLSARGAGRRALEKSIRQWAEIPTLKVKLPMDGKTDLLIVREALAEVESSVTPETILSDEFLSTYDRHLTSELSRCRHFRVLPGVPELLARLEQSERFLSGLATGNLQGGARRKLSRARLLGFFHFGGFGCDSESRTEIVRAAVQRGAQILGRRFSGKSIVIGDTPRDIEHAREAGVKVVAVATGSYGTRQLRSCRPDAVFLSLSDVEEVLRTLERI